MASPCEDLSASALAEQFEETPETESTPLLKKKYDKTPIPWFQTAILLLIQITEPITANVIYPFVNQFVRRTGITGGKEASTGYYAGIIESTFFIAEALTALAWQRLSDKFGRRPMLLIAPLGLGIAMLAFGSSHVFWLLVVARCFQGVFNGDIGITKTVMGEITDSSNRADVIAFIPPMWSTGMLLGPLIGGVFSFPAKRWPETLGKISFLRENPFFLPCAITAVICFIAFGFALVGLEETAPLVQKWKSERRPDSPLGESLSPLDSPQESSGSIDTDSSADVAASLRDILTQPVVIVLLNYGFVAFVDMSNLALQPLIWSTSIEHGGLGFDALTIGTINTCYGIPNSLFQMFVLGRIMRHFGPKKLAIPAMAGSVVAMSLYPLENHLAKQAGCVDWKVWIILIAQLLFSGSIFMAYASLQWYLVEVSPAPSALGTIQGLAQTAAVVFRAAAPVTATSLFAVSTEHNLLGGYLVFILIGILDLAAISSAFFLPKARMSFRGVWQLTEIGRT